MTQREKVLAGCLIGVIVSYGGYKVAKSKVYEPRQQLVQDVKDERNRLEKLEVRLSGADKIVRDWQKQTGQTLHLDSSTAHQAFREDVTALLERNNLTKVQGWTIREHKASIEKKGVRKGFVELPLAVQVTGTLGDLVNFLKDFYQRPYLVCVDKLSLNAEGGGSPRGRRDKDADQEPKLSISMALSTLVLPKVEGLDHPTIDLARMDYPEAEPALAMVPRLEQEDPVAYNEIARVNFFKIYVAPTPPRQTATVARNDDKPPPPPPPPPPLDPRRDAHKFVLEGMGFLDDGPIAYVVNTDRSMVEPPTQYRLNDEADDGKVVLIVPQGMVVRVVPKPGRPEPTTDYFYPLGKSFKEREEVNPNEHPAIERVLREVLKQ